MIPRLRSLRTRSNILPFVVMALTLRALLPMQWMSSTGDLMVLSAMCSTTDAVETVRIPGDQDLGGAADAAGASHCDLCALPLVVPSAITAAPQFVATLIEPVTANGANGHTGFLERAQSARGPPIFI